MFTVFGATGDLGSRIVRLLRTHGRAVRAVSRDRSRLQAAVSLGAEPVVADLRRPETLPSALRGSEVVLTTANAILGTRENDLRRVDVEGNAALIETVRGLGIRRFVFVSAHGADQDSPVDFLRAKALTETRLEASGLSGAILRPSAFMEIWAALLGDPVVAGKAVQVFGRGENPVPFVASDDVARVAVALATGAERTGVERVDLGGPEALTALEVVALFSRVAGREARIRHVPRAVLRAGSTLLRAFAPNPARLMAAALWMDTHDQRIDSAPVTVRFGMLISLADFARQRLARRAPSPDVRPGIA